MGNQGGKSNDFIWGASELAGDAGLLNFGNRSRHKSFEPGIKKGKNPRKPRATKNASNRIAKPFTAKKLRGLLGKQIPVIVALLTDTNCRVSFDNKPVAHCQSDHSNKPFPCDPACRRVKSYPCATYCPECDKKTSAKIPTIHLTSKHV